MCLIFMKYSILILIIIMISLGQVLLSYVANTSRAHACARTRAHACASTHTAVAAVQVSDILWRPPVTTRSAGIHSRLQGHSNKHTRWPPDFPEILDVFRVNKLLGRTETRTRYRMYFQTIRTVRDISRDDRARIATCSLRTPTDRLKVEFLVLYIRVSSLSLCNKYIHMEITGNCPNVFNQRAGTLILRHASLTIFITQLMPTQNLSRSSEMTHK